MPANNACIITTKNVRDNVLAQGDADIIKKRPRFLGRDKTLYKRRALDSNQRIPYDIGSLANCWFKPLTQPSLNHFFVKERCKYTTYFCFSKIFTDIFINYCQT